GGNLELPKSVNSEGLSRALDPSFASVLFARLENGERGILQRSIYTEAGQLLFDDVVQRLQRDDGFRKEVKDYARNFELLAGQLRGQSRLRALAELQGSGLGRGYLLLLHASGRIG